jgi:hypothetical protein
MSLKAMDVSRKANEHVTGPEDMPRGLPRGCRRVAAQIEAHSAQFESGMKTVNNASVPASFMTIAACARRKAGIEGDVLCPIFPAS